MTPPDGPLHALLMHDQALRGLARGLLADAHAAEDLAQDTWLAALSRGADPETPRAWLASVARNLAAKLRRGEERRVRRERDSARNEREPGDRRGARSSGAPELRSTPLGPRTLAASETWDCGAVVLGP
ncbi:MAG TPA: sigma factor [Planctomycetota bacterium]